MNDHLSENVRANVERIRIERGMSYYRLGRLMGKHPTQARTLLRRDYGFTLSTVHDFATALEVDPLDLLLPHQDAA